MLISIEKKKFKPDNTYNYCRKDESCLAVQHKEFQKSESYNRPPVLKSKQNIHTRQKATHSG